MLLYDIFCKHNCNIIMNKERINNYILNYTEQRLASGKLFFTQDELKFEFNLYSEAALISALNRLIKKGKAVSIHKGFYLIIPPDRMAKGILPPYLFIDSLMNYLSRTYYVGLLSAAVYYGASHQQAQEYFIFINKPPLRTKNKKGLKLNFVVQSVIPKVGIVKKKTETGYINISSAELTALDLVKYQSNVGGMNRVVSVLSELVDEMKSGKLREILESEKVSITSLQRLGYILDKLEEKNLSDVILDYLADKRKSKISLKPEANKKSFSYNSKWKIIENVELDFDL